MSTKFLFFLGFTAFNLILPSAGTNTTDNECLTSQLFSISKNGLNIDSYFLDKIDYLNKMDLNYLNERLMKEGDFNTASECQEASFEYKKFLLLILINLKQNKNLLLTPSKSVDLIWHKHILHMKEYETDCYNLLDSNSLIYHNPKPETYHLCPDCYESEYQNTINLYQDTFNTIPPVSIWNQHSDSFMEPYNTTANESTIGSVADIGDVTTVAKEKKVKKVKSLEALCNCDSTTNSPTASPTVSPVAGIKAKKVKKNKGVDCEAYCAAGSIVSLTNLTTSEPELDIWGEEVECPDGTGFARGNCDLFAENSCAQAGTGYYCKLLEVWGDYYCCPSVSNVKSGQDIITQKTFTEQVKYYYDNEKGKFVLIIVGLIAAVVLLVVMVLVLVCKLRKYRSGKYSSIKKNEVDEQSVQKHVQDQERATMVKESNIDPSL